jgi:hypothetical protein
MTNRMRITLLSGAILGFGVAVWIFHLYPVMIVDGQMLSLRRFEKLSTAATYYYTHATELYASKGVLLKEMTPEERNAEVLSAFVDRVIIHQELLRRAGSETDRLVKNRLALSVSSGLQDASVILSGLSYADFTDEVLLPQAERDVLAGRLFADGMTLDGWLTDARKKASVHIFSSRYSVQDGVVVPRN